MPTASTAQFLSNVEAMEPQTSNLYSRRTLAGEFPVINTNLVRTLIKRGTWSVNMKNQIIAHGGSIQRVIGIHPEVKAVYKTAWEMSMKSLIDMAADRGAYVCQSQSLNLFVPEPNVKSLSSMHFYAWKRGLKTGCYYLRTKAASSAIKVTACLSCSG
jgi:ribonucleotide reductase alpha subunit